MDAALKRQIRAELFRCAIGGTFLTYTQFYNRIRPGQTMGNFPYQTHFDAIAREERDFGYPDVTFMVHGTDGYPHQVDFRPFDRNDAKQVDSLHRGTDALILMYCPGATNPY
jgi:hypothetical protein